MQKYQSETSIPYMVYMLASFTSVREVSQNSQLEMNPSL